MVLFTCYQESLNTNVHCSGSWAAGLTACALGLRTRGVCLISTCQFGAQEAKLTDAAFIYHTTRATISGLNPASPPVQTPHLRQINALVHLFRRRRRQDHRQVYSQLVMIFGTSLGPRAARLDGEVS
jgi:hypothetical protein